MYLYSHFCSLFLSFSTQHFPLLFLHYVRVQYGNDPLCKSQRKKTRKQVILHVHVCKSTGKDVSFYPFIIMCSGENRKCLAVTLHTQNQAKQLLSSSLF